MAQKENRIINHWSFLAFAGEFGKVINRQHWNPAEGAPFETLSFRQSKDTTEARYVHFSKNLGELTNQQLKSLMNDLQVVELKVDPEVLASRAEKGQQLETYKLCRKGEVDFGEEIDLF